jgi:hypothetical protein
MPRTTLPKTSLAGSYPGNSVTPTFTAADVDNGNQFIATGKELLLVKNVGSTTRSITLNSASDSYGREADITETIAAGVSKLFGPFQLNGWAQSPTYAFEVNATHVDVQIAVLVLP